SLSIIPSVAGGVDASGNGYLSQEEIERYSRHLIMPEVAMEGQKKIKQASV
ncbi:MAG: molybdenum cofactor biosynthesis protein MoeB, partial [Gammaproteobacteria bacterium]|nr:molybdenum cofactor biosynthesis protein MoeB [Gammaproteobacteria bacterium]